MDSSEVQQQNSISIDSSSIQVQDEQTPLLFRYYQNTRCYDRLAMGGLMFIFSVGLVIGVYLLILEDCNDNFELIAKNEWSKIQSKTVLRKLKLPVKNITLIELDSTKCTNKNLSTTECLQNLQKKQIFKYKEPDIPYNFIIDGNGTIYEGRGWKNCTDNKGTSDKHLTIATLLGKMENSRSAIKTNLHKFLENAVTKDRLEPCFNIISQNSTYIRNIAFYLVRRRHYC